MSLRSPLGRARGLGSAKEGVDHFWQQRLTALALVPLAIWFVIAVVSLIGVDHAALVKWMGHPVNASLMILTLIATLHHAQLGLQVVIEDYVHTEATKLFAVISVKFLAAALTVLGSVSVLKLACGG